MPSLTNNMDRISGKPAVKEKVIKRPTNSRISFKEETHLPGKKQSLKKWWIITALGVIAAVSLLGYLGYKNMVLAWVDNTPITKLTLYKQLEEKYGKDFTEQLISEALILKEAEAKGVQVSETDIDAEIKKIEDQQGGADKLKQAMDAQNVTMIQLRNQIKYKQMIDKSFGKDVTISDQEVNDYMEKNKEQIPPVENMQASESAKLKQQVADSLKAEKINKSFQDWLRESLQSSRVKRF